jgi:segregation and condensation protein B
MLMNESHIRNVIEAALLAAGKPLQPAELVELFDEGARPEVQAIQAALAALADEYSNRGIEIKETAAGFRIQVRKELANEISRLWSERPARYSRALLETLALIAYRQPITRAEIEAVRGVAVNPNILKTVIERNWVRVVGHRDVPGRPELLGTTREFLDYFGLKSLDELPALVEIKSLGDIKVQFELPDAGPVGLLGVEGVGEIEGAAAVAVAATEGADASGAPDGAAATDSADAVGAPDASAEGVATAEVVASDGAGESVATGEVAGSEGAAEILASGELHGSDGAAELVIAGEVAESGGAGNSGAANGSDAVAAGDDAKVDVESHAIKGRRKRAAVAKEDGGVAADASATAGVDAHSVGAAGATRTNAGTAPDAEAVDASHAATHSARHEAEEFAASVDAELAAGDDDGSDEDELSAAGPGASELVAGPRDLDD